MAKVSGGGIAYRYGGEEFTVIYPRKSIEQVQEHMEKLREIIQDYSMQVRSVDRKPDTKKEKRNNKAKRGSGAKENKQLSVTISIGLAERTEDARSPEEVIKAADKALYRAKKKGRNCVSV